MRVFGVCLGLFVTGICSAGDIPRTVSPWPLDANLGSHRALIRVVEPADAVRVRIPWRRRDVEPQAKAVIVVDAKTQKRVEKVAAIRIERHPATSFFSPRPRPATITSTTCPTAPRGTPWTGRATVTSPPRPPPIRNG